MNLYIIFFIIITILFFPIKIKLSSIYEENSLVIYIYAFKIFDSRSKNKPSIKKTEELSKKHTKNILKHKFTKNLNLNSIREINTFLLNSKIKPSIKTDLNLCYSLEDAMACALLEGILYSISYIPIWILSNYVHIKDWNLTVTPKFNDRFIKFKSICIIYFNLANIIYILLNIIKIILKSKGSVDNGYAPNR